MGHEIRAVVSQAVYGNIYMEASTYTLVSRHHSSSAYMWDRTDLLVVPARKHDVGPLLRQPHSRGLPYARVCSRDHTHPSRHGVAGR